jgi:hypothetical protein
MADSILSFVNSTSFRNSLVARNLPPYTLNGLYTPPSGQQNYEYSVSDFNVIDSPNELISQNPFVRNNQTLNEYSPNNGYRNTIINSNLPVTPNQGEYNLSDTRLDLVNEFYIDAAYIENRYGPIGGFNNMVVIDSIQNNNRLYVPYWEPPTFIPSSYSPYNILLSNDPTGSNGLLSQDSFIAKLGARFLKDSIQARIDAEIFQRTLGSVNLDSLSDPFEASLVATGREPLIYRDYRITVPENPVTASADLLIRLTGAYLPFSLIPGNYFLENEPSAGMSQQTSNALNVINRLTGGFLGPILNKTRNPSEIFLANTGGGQRSVLFQTINYNKYQPFYERGFGQLLISALDSITNGTSAGRYYVGSRTSEPSTITSPPNQIPVDGAGRQIQTNVYGPSELGILYEGNQNQLNFGLAGKSLTDGGDITGQFVWTSPKYKGSAGFKATQGGGKGSSDKEFNRISSQYTNNESTNITFKQDSILDSTQRLINSADNTSGEARLKHVGNAINQVSKVFNDGYKEITKGSKVLSYTDNTTGEERGVEYCRIFTKDTPYYTYADLQKSDGITTSGRRFNNSILDNTYNLNIVPIKGENSTNIVKDAKGNFIAKKYMFSIENLAWRTSSRPGFTYDELPTCEKGPNGGRVMWFPPYNLKFSDSSTANFNSTTFLGRPEPIYTYKDTSRKGSISWTIIVDNPSIINLLVDKQLKNKDDQKINSIMDSFFAGCVKYDIYELAKKFNTIPLSDLYTYQEILNNPRLTTEEYLGVVTNIEKNPVSNANTTATGNKDEESKQETTVDPRITQIQTDFASLAFYFEDNTPGPNGGTTSNVSYLPTYTTYSSTTNVTTYQTKANAIFKSNSDYCSKTGNIPNTNVSYNEYCNRAKNTTSFFNTVIFPQFNKTVNEFIPKVFEVLNESPNNKISINMIGSASALGDVDYNLNLSKRRVDSVKKFFETYVVGDISLKNFIENKQFIIKNIETKGEEIIIPQTETGDYGFEINCTNNVIGGDGLSTPAAGRKYSVNAMACRRVRIETINVDIPQKPQEPQLPADKNKEEEVLKIKPIPRIQPTVDVIKKLKDGIGKKILRNLITECDYFELIEKEVPMVYSSFKEKIKHFNPAFHSMTPEGLNSRLTFLNQCVRPGETIPVIGTDGRPKYNDAINTAFGTPPVLILRIGDFYNTKIIPGSVSFTYDPITYDMNPEGIGVQPMMVNVSLDFTIIGGMGLKEPIEQLQNALSFNYYANTEIYDERATPTEDTSTIDKDIVDALLKNQPTASNPGQLQPNPGGDTIGTIITNIPIIGGQSGETSFRKIMDNLVGEVKNYMTTVVNKLESINNTYNYGVVLLLDFKREFTTGELVLGKTFLGSNPTNILIKANIDIYGKPNFEGLIEDQFNRVIKNIEDGSNPIISGLTKFFTSSTNTPIPNVKTNLINYIKELKTTYSNGIATTVQELVSIQEGLVKTIRKINTVLSGIDGKILESGKPRIYKLFGTSELTPPVNNQSNTEGEMGNDYLRFRNLIMLDSGFNKLLETQKIFGGTNYNNGDFTVKTTNSLTTITDKAFFMLIARILTNKDKKQQFIDSVISGNLKDWKTPVKLLNKFENIVDNLVKNYEKELKLEEKIFQDLKKDKRYKDLTDGVEDKLYPLGKVRKFTYTTIGGTTEDDKMILDLYSSVNSNNDRKTFNGKNTFN